jgi:hypothetical protein
VFGLTEAWWLMARNATAASGALMGLGGAMGFVVALDGVIGAVSLGLLAPLAALIPRVRRLNDTPAWAAFCAALFAGLLVLALGLEHFGVLAGTVRGARAALLAGASAAAGSVIGLAAFGAARHVFRASRPGAARLARRTAAVIWALAAGMPLAYAVLGSRLP